MTGLEKKIVRYVNEMHRKCIYQYDRHQLLHGVRYQKDVEPDRISSIRELCRDDSMQAAYELKTYYLENGILSNTIVLKMRPETPDIQEISMIKIYSEAEDGAEGAVHEYICHAIEIFREHGRYKVLDVLHRDRTMWLESYLDEVCQINHCDRKRLRYDMGYLAPCHAFADNMQELSDLMKYLDKKYDLGQPRLNLIHVPVGESCFLSDDVAMDFEEFGREFHADQDVVRREWTKIYGGFMGIRFNTLHMLCLGHIMRDPIIKLAMVEALFDDEKMCQMIDEFSDMQGRGWW